MAAIQIHQQIAKAQLHPREWLLRALREHGSQRRLTQHLGIVPNAEAYAHSQRMAVLKLVLIQPCAP